MTAEPQTARRTSPETAVLVMVGINIIWGAAYPITKPALADIPPISFALLRFALALALLLPLAGAETLRLLRGPERGRLLLMGIVGFGVVQVAQTVALRLSPASDIALLAATSPLWVALLAWPWLGERLGRQAVFGFGLAAGGMLVALWPDTAGGALDGWRLAGDALYLVSSAGWAGYNIMGREIMRRAKPLPVTAAACLIGTLAILPFAALEWASGALPRLSAPGAFGVLYTGLLVTVLGYLTLFWALGRARAAPIGATMYIQPLAGVLLAWAMLGEPLTARFFAGGALVLLGVVLASRRG